MLSPHDTSQNLQNTDAFEQLPRPFNRRSIVAERRQSILQQKQVEKQTDPLPSLGTGTSGSSSVIDTPAVKPVWRQVTHLREENRHLRFEVEELHSEVQRLTDEYTTLQAEFQKIAVVHTGQVQELEQYQTHLREAIEERDRLQETYTQLERRYQELYASFRGAVEEEAHKLVTEAAQTLILSPNTVPLMLQDALKTLEMHARQVEDTHLIEVLYLKNEIQRINELLQREYQQIEEERQRLLIMQHTVSEQARLRYETIQTRLNLRWKVALVFSTTCLLALLVVLQYVTLFLFHVTFTPILALALIAPIIVCTILAVLLAQPLSTLRFILKSAPHKD